MPVAGRAMQHEAPVGLDRAAEIHRQIGKIGLLEGDVDALEKRGQAHVGGRLTMIPMAPFSLCSAM
jgi:hypothetical protein